jgi:hypothetical protein
MAFTSHAAAHCAQVIRGMLMVLLLTYAPVSARIF